MCFCSCSAALCHPSVCSFVCLVVVIGSLRERRWGNPTPTRPGLNFCASTNEFQLCCVGLAVGSLVLRGGGTISLIPRCILNRRKTRFAPTLSAADATAAATAAAAIRLRHEAVRHACFKSLALDRSVGDLFLFLCHTHTHKHRSLVCICLCSCARLKYSIHYNVNNVFKRIAFWFIVALLFLFSPCSQTLFLLSTIYLP